MIYCTFFEGSSVKFGEGNWYNFVKETCEGTCIGLLKDVANYNHSLDIKNLCNFGS